MQQGYIKLHRSLQDCWLWNDSEPFDKRSAWVDLLLMANHADKKICFEGNVLVIHKGQFLTSILKLSNRWKWERKKTTRFLNLLESDEMITTNRTAHGTTITIVNWEKFQCDGTTNSTTKRTTDGQHMGQQMDNTWDTNKNDKNDKNDKNITKAAKRYVDDEPLNNAIKDFIDHRKKLRKPMSDKAVELFINRVNKLCPGNTAGQIELINTAIERGWQTVYPSKEKAETVEPVKSDSKLSALEQYYLQEGN